jgi:hypothetical protein
MNDDKPVTEEELGFVIHAVHPEGAPPDVSLSRGEIRIAVIAFGSYHGDQKFINGIIESP